MVVDVFTVYTHLHESSAWSVAAECWNTCSRTNARIQPTITIITNFFANEIDSIARCHTLYASHCLPNRQRNTHKHNEIFSMRKRHFSPLKNTIVAALSSIATAAWTRPPIFSPSTRRHRRLRFYWELCHFHTYTYSSFLCLSDFQMIFNGF